MKGQKTGGRQKGTPNKVTSDIRQAYRQIIEDNLPNVDKWLKKIAEDRPERALMFIIRLSDYVIPKMQSIQFTDDFDNMSDDQLDRIIDELKNVAE